jgi:membrane associated rhomboid family serine protease
MMVDQPYLPSPEKILLMVSANAPHPWYPRTGPFPPELGREQLDAQLDQLRLAGLIALTEWTPEHGQGYVLTEGGKQVLNDPRELERLRAHRPLRRKPVMSEEDTLESPEGNTWERGEAARRALLSYTAPTVTYILLALNIAIFILGYYLDIGHQPLKNFLSLKGTDLVGNDWRWLRLITCCFAHADVLHIVMNMYALYVLGPLLERIWGHFRFLILYLISGLGGSCAAMAFKPLDTPEGPLVNLLGASGAIWGLMVSFAVWVYLNRHHLSPELVGNWQRSLVSVFLINVILSFLPGISAAGHFGGGAVGGLCALVLHWQRFGSPLVKLLGLLGLAGIPLLCLGFLLAAMERSPAWGTIHAFAQSQKVKRETEELEAALPGIHKGEKKVLENFNTNVAPLLNRNSSRRPKENVATALGVLREGEGGLQEIADRLRRLGPYRDREVEEARQARLGLVEAYQRLLEISRQCLVAGEDWTEKDQTRLDEAQDQANKARKHWQGLVVH